MTAFPMDWILMLLGVELHTAEWLRLPKMLFVQSTSKLGFGSANRAKNSGVTGLAVTAFFLLHLSATVWSALGLTTHPVITLGEPSWFRASTAQEFLSNMSILGDTEISKWDLYILSLNWVATHTVSAIGNSTLYPKNYVEVLFAIVQMTIGMTFYRMFMGKISTVVMKKDEAIIKVRSELSSLESFITANNINDDKELSDEIRRNFVLKNASQTIEMSTILNELSFSLQFELASLLCRAELDHIGLFKGVSDAALDCLSINLREVTHTPEEVLFRAGDLADEMYSVVSGAIEILDEDVHGGQSVTGVLKKGSALGEASFAFGMKHLHGARAKAGIGSTCLRLARSNYLEVLKQFPEDQELIMSNSLVSFDQANSNRSRSKKSKSMNGSGEKNAGVPMQQEREEQEERSIDSVGINSDSDSSADSLIGAGMISQIETLKARQNSTRVQQLLDAAFHGDVKKIEKIVSKLNINNSDVHKRTALHLAASEGQLEAVQFLIEHGADASAQDEFANTPLNDAVRHKHDDIAAVIRQHCQSNNLRGSAIVLSGCQAAVAMLTCSYRGDLTGVQRFINNGVEVNCSDYDGRTALHLAACEGHTEIVDYLLLANANPNARDRFGGTALHDSIRHHQAAAIHTKLKDAGCQLVGMVSSLLEMCLAAGKPLSESKIGGRGGGCIQIVRYLSSE